MELIGRLLKREESARLSPDEQQAAARVLRAETGRDIYASSVSCAPGRVLALAREGRARHLVVAAPANGLGGFSALAGSVQTISTGGEPIDVAVVERSHDAAVLVRDELPWTAPKVVGLTRSVGLGDRTGLATPGHVMAVAGSGCVPFLAQQSIREMTRTRRTPAGVMDDATFGVLQAGYRDGFGSDADHLKTADDINATDAVGFTMFTIDPGDHVNPQADAMSGAELADAFDALPWTHLEISPDDLRHRYLNESFALDGGEAVSFTEETLARAAVKYAGAIAHTTMMYRHLKSLRGSRPFELEVSVDETDTPTTVPEHYLIASELKRLGVEWVSLAPRFIGDFEKGIDYKGDLGAFEASYAQHIAIARTLGPYKLSLHSGSDKFSVYPIAAKLSGEMVHLKTAGTSYLEALRVAARKNPQLFRRILDFAFERFDEDRQSYHISADVSVIPTSGRLADDRLESVLAGNDGRQLLHVTFGSVLTWQESDGRYRFRNELLETLIDHEDEHYAVLAEHLGRHVRPFTHT